MKIEIHQRLCHLPLVMDMLRRSRVLTTIDHGIVQHRLSLVSTGECVAVILAGVFVGTHSLWAFVSVWRPMTWRRSCRIRGSIWRGFRKSVW